MLSLVTGAAGFVGGALVGRLLERGDTVRAVILPGDRDADALRARSTSERRLEIVDADVRDAANLSPAFAGVERVFHTAALVHAWAPWETFRAVNVRGTQNVARAAQQHGVGRLVHVSTSDVFGIPRRGEAFDESSPFRRWNEPYADTKIEAEEWLWRFHRETDLPLAVIYPGWVYGPGDRAFFPGLAEAIREGLMMFWYRGVRLAWVYIDNLVDACLLASVQPAALGQGFLVHDGDDGPTLEEVCDRIAAAVGTLPARRHVPYAAALASAWALQAIWVLLRRKSPPLLQTVDVKAFGFQWRLSNRKVQEVLGWSPRVGTNEGMQAALEALSRRRVDE